MGAFPGSHDYASSEHGFPATVISHGPATNSEFTVGVTYKPNLPAPISTLMLRAELRYDRALTSNTPCNAGKSSGATAADAVLGF